jgi:hypothetical protein
VRIVWPYKGKLFDSSASRQDGIGELKWFQLPARLLVRGRVTQAKGIDPEDNGSDRSDDENISGNEISLRIKRSAEDVGKYDGYEGDEADQSFHDVVHLGINNYDELEAAINNS